ncbi:MAG: hypothetical protein M3Y69_07285 [Verrucomicrobiota bacterium]|nr:hypothetical protein [Verrucomicrobiota bacterium]
MENVWFLVLVAVVGVIRWAFQAAETRKNEQAARRNEPPPTSPLQRAPAETEEERMRRFFEALGVPKGASAPPRRVVPRAPKQIMPVDAFPLPRSTVGPAPAPVAAQEPIVVIPPVSPAPAPTVIPVAIIPALTSIPQIVVEPIDQLRTGLAARLANADGLRDAIVLREIFGPPRSMQPLNER